MMICLPYEIGDILYRINGEHEIVTTEVTEVMYKRFKDKITITCDNWFTYSEEDFGTGLFYTKDGAMWEICYIKDVDDFEYFDLLQAKNIQEAFNKAQKMVKGQIVGVKKVEYVN